ncbi:MAG TPA: DHHA1 domain-containing protein [bacterium]|nr:DHHA1 domain-containing protein [bacterium]
MTGKFKAGDVAKIITTITGGGGGGTPMFAQAGVKDVSKLKFAIDEFKKTL